jgi:hypothetical protein
MFKGCGRGYDVVMLALHGFDAYGLEISDTAVKEAEKYASAELAKPSAYHFGSEQRSSRTPGLVTFFQGDFFSSQWEFKGGIDENTKFDVIYDYTVRFIILLAVFSKLLISFGSSYVHYTPSNGDSGRQVWLG